jgi:DNA-binding transcriptional regulator YiaG
MHAATKAERRSSLSGGEYFASLMAELDRAKISLRIKQARTEVGLSQPELADVLQVHWRTIQNWEDPKQRRLPFDRMDELAMVCEVTKAWLLHGEDPATQPLTEDMKATLDELLALVKDLQERLPRQSVPEQPAAQQG